MLPVLLEIRGVTASFLVFSYVAAFLAMRLGEMSHFALLLQLLSAFSCVPGVIRAQGDNALACYCGEEFIEIPPIHRYSQEVPALVDL